jgi:GNAT superfamily N-acetyltransferase
MNIRIRSVTESDERCWRELWNAYTRFYNRELSEEITRHTWVRMLDNACPVRGILAELENTSVVGIANYVIHESTSKLTPLCCLQDLFVQPGHRSAGIGKGLIDWLVAEMKSQGWSRLYWHTAENNYRARTRYDQYTSHSGFLRYVIENSG